MTTVHGCATVALPSHLEFYGKPGNQVVDTTCGPSKIYLPFCAEDRAFAIVLAAKAEGCLEVLDGHSEGLSFSLDTRPPSPNSLFFFC